MTNAAYMAFAYEFDAYVYARFRRMSRFGPLICARRFLYTLLVRWKSVTGARVNIRRMKISQNVTVKVMTAFIMS